MLSCHEASRILGVPCQMENPSIHIQGSSIDTRTIEAGNLFVALSGARADGHQFLADAFLKGAAAALIDQTYYSLHREEFLRNHQAFQNLFPVADVIQAFSDLALWYRSQMAVKAVGITGSTGKTSTKEFLSFLLKQNYPILSNQGNFNNQLGLPLTLFRLQPSHRFLVAELGASQKGDIGHLGSLLKPDAGILTQISPAHLKTFGTIKDVYDAKTELFKVLPREAPIVIPEYDELLRARAEKYELRIITVGYTRDADYCINDVRSEAGFVSFVINQKFRFRFRGYATFLSYNAALAVAMAEALGISCEEMPGSWDQMQLPKGRFQSIFYPNGIQIIDDSYNANPVSFKKAIETFSAMDRKGRKILVISDMLELGENERLYHEQLADEISHHRFDSVVAFGSLAKYSIEKLKEANSAGPFHYFAEAQDAAQYLQDHVQEGDSILIKASRGMKMENLIRKFEEKFGAPGPVNGDRN